MVPYKIFAINPGSTSTKIALFEGNQPVFSSNVAHDAEVLKQYREISDQFDYRKETILEEVEKAGVSLEGVDAFSARGGGLVSVEGGVYVVNDKLLEHARAGQAPGNAGSTAGRCIFKDIRWKRIRGEPSGCG